MDAYYMITASGTHLARPKDAFGLCGEPIQFSWQVGEKTTTGLSATCSRCRQIALLQPTRF